MNFRLWAGLFLALILGCDSISIPWSWVKYEHPTYRLSFSHPRSWKVQEGGSLGSTLTIVPPEDDPLFRVNANLVVEAIGENAKLKEIGEKSKTQLQLLLQDYELLAYAPTKLGALEAVEIRGKYRASEGERLIRTRIALTPSYMLVWTFTCRLELESKHEKTFARMMESFKI